MIKLGFKVLFLCSLCFNLFFLSGSHAATLANLYEVSVPVFSQSEAERVSATTKALEELLIRVTGQRDIAGLESGQALLAKSQRYVRSFRYEVLPPPIKFTSEEIATSGTVNPLLEALEAAETVETAEVVEEDEKPQPTQKIIVSFDEKAIKNSLWKYKLPVWSKTRPSTLIWLAIEEQSQRKMLDANEPSELLALIKEHAKKRGIPLVYPQLDKEDQLKINVTDVWGGFKDPVTKASERYQAEAVISAQFFLDQAGVWQTQWRLYQAGDESSWQLSAPHLNVIVYEGIDKLASILADRYAQVSSGEDDSRFLIRISDVSDLADYEKINRYLKSQSAIKHAELTQIQSTEMVYELELRSNMAALKQAIALGKTLVAQDDPFAAEVDKNRLNYRLRK